MNEFHNVGQVGLVVDVNDSFPDQPVDNHGAAGDLEVRIHRIDRKFDSNFMV